MQLIGLLGKCALLSVKRSTDLFRNIGGGSVLFVGLVAVLNLIIYRSFGVLSAVENAFDRLCTANIAVWIGVLSV